MERILVTGAGGQIGSELIGALRERHGAEAVIASDVRAVEGSNGRESGRFERLDVTDAEALAHVIERHDVGIVYHLASLLSAVGERAPDRAWHVNVDGLKHVLDAARRHALRVFWPSSIAVFGAETPRRDVPQHTVLDPRTVYGVSKVSGELLCRYYHERFGVDVRSLRYPGLISHVARPGGGTTDYAVEIFYAAVRGEPYRCFVRPEVRLPMMYMPDALRATLELMEAPAEAVRVRTSYNVAAMSFSAEELAAAIRRRRPGLEVTYAPDERQRIAVSWPESIDDRAAREDWGWRPDYDLDTTVADMLAHLETRIASDAEPS